MVSSFLLEKRGAEKSFLLEDPLGNAVWLRREPPRGCADSAPSRLRINLRYIGRRKGYPKRVVGRAPRLEPRPEPSEVKNPLPLRPALARTFRSCEGMPRVLPSRLESTP